MASQDHKKNAQGANPPATIPTIPTVTSERFAKVLYQEYLEWVKAGRPKRS